MFTGANVAHFSKDHKGIFDCSDFGCLWLSWEILALLANDSEYSVGKCQFTASKVKMYTSQSRRTIVIKSSFLTAPHVCSFLKIITIESFLLYPFSDLMPTVQALKWKLK